MGSPCLFTRQQALKLGYFYLLRVKNSNLLITELGLCFLKHTKFYLEHKASFIQISSITSFNSFLSSSVICVKIFKHGPCFPPRKGYDSASTSASFPFEQSYRLKSGKAKSTSQSSGFTDIF